MMRRTAHTDQPSLPNSRPGLSKRVKDRVVCADVSSVIAHAKPIPTMSSPMALVFLLRPRLRAATTLIQSSSRPTMLPAMMVSITMMPVRV